MECRAESKTESGQPSRQLRRTRALSSPPATVGELSVPISNTELPSLSLHPLPPPGAHNHIVSTRTRSVYFGGNHPYTKATLERVQRARSQHTAPTQLSFLSPTAPATHGYLHSSCRAMAVRTHRPGFREPLCNKPDLAVPTVMCPGAPSRPDVKGVPVFHDAARSSHRTLPLSDRESNPEVRIEIQQPKESVDIALCRSGAARAAAIPSPAVRCPRDPHQAPEGTLRTEGGILREHAVLRARKGADGGHRAHGRRDM